VENVRSAEVQRGQSGSRPRPQGSAADQCETRTVLKALCVARGHRERTICMCGYDMHSHNSWNRGGFQERIQCYRRRMYGNVYES